jgi:hypothetical protein
MQNLSVAGWPLKPGALGIHLEFRTVISHMSTMDALLELEAHIKNAGQSLLPIYFPGRILPEEEAQWEALRLRSEREEATRLQHVQAGQASAAPPMLTSWILHAKSYKGQLI